MTAAAETTVRSGEHPSLSADSASERRVSNEARSMKRSGAQLGPGFTMMSSTISTSLSLMKMHPRSSDCSVVQVTSPFSK